MFLLPFLAEFKKIFILDLICTNILCLQIAGLLEFIKVGTGYGWHQ